MNSMPSLIGSRVSRLEDDALLRGRGRFVDDIVVPGVLQVAFVRSPHPHALIRSVSKTAALSAPGVHAVLTLDDLAPVMAQRRMLRHSNSGTPLDGVWAFALADGEVSYVGEAVALVVADDRYLAEDAAALVEIDYETLPAAADCRKAARPDAPAVRRELKSNVIASYRVAYGDAEAAFGKAAHVLHEDFWQHRGAAHSIEGRGILVDFRGADDSLTIWASTQKAHDLRQSLTVLLDIDESRLRVAAPDIGPVGFAFEEDREHACLRLVASTRANGAAHRNVFDRELLLSAEFEEARRIARELTAAGEPPYRLGEGEKTETVVSIRSAVDRIMAAARKGLESQRYKGLGEMNPTQLWETTMDPGSRTLLQVKIEDAYEADEIFSTLMGDEVEPRRKFIEENALNVRNLDV